MAQINLQNIARDDRTDEYIYEVGKVATSVTSLIAKYLSGNISGNRVATTSYINVNVELT